MLRGVDNPILGWECSDQDQRRETGGNVFGAEICIIWRGL
jgi:hypothetical protein